jgi:hypothetical protein
MKDVSIVSFDPIVSSGGRLKDHSVNITLLD